MPLLLLPLLHSAAFPRTARRSLYGCWWALLLQLQLWARQLHSRVVFVLRQGGQGAERGGADLEGAEV